MNHPLFIFFLSILMFNNLYSQTEISLAYNAYRNCDFIQAEKRYRLVLNSEESPEEDKVIAAGKLACFAWKVYQDIEESRKLTALVLTLDPKNLTILQDQANYELEADNFKEARDLLEDALKITEFENEKSRIRIAKANIELQEAISLINQKQAINKNVLSVALNTTNTICDKNQGNLDYAEIQLGLALLMKDGESAYTAWKSYFRIPSGEKPDGLLLRAEERLHHAFAHLDEDDLTDSVRNNLIMGLAYSRFYHYADLMSKYIPLGNSIESEEVKEVQSYYEFCIAVDELSNTYHRDVVLKGLSTEKREIFYNQLLELKQQLWSKLTWHERELKLNAPNFKDELYNRFGTIIKDVKPYYTFHGKTGLFLFAHSVEDKYGYVEQFGYKTEVHFVKIDFMYANSLDGWFLGSKTGRMGGWNEKDLIVQFRRAYSERPVQYWEMISNQQSKTAWENKITRLKQEDEKIAKDNPYAYLPGLVNSMRYNACNRLKDSLKNSGINGDDLRMKFISSFEDREMKASLYAHEGRHRIDQKYRFVYEPFSKNFEFRAKLSEVSFSDDPFFTLAFSPVYSSRLNDKGKHAYGSKKTVIGLVDWMEVNQEEIVGFNPNQPALPQLELLTESQLLTAFNTMEPIKRNPR